MIKVTERLVKTNRVEETVERMKGGGGSNLISG